MPSKATSAEPSAADARDIWRRIAGWWDNAIGEGNEFQSLLIMPATDRLLDLKPNQVVLDICCGNGNYARRMGRAGAQVVACDVAETFIQRAAERTTAADGNIAYHAVDVTDESALLALGASRFDSAVCSMAVMDLPTVGPLYRAVAQLLKPGGRFVFSVPHPCFNSGQLHMTAELVEDEGKLSQIYGVHVASYLTPTAHLSSGIINQPEPHYLFHRPLSLLLAEGFAAGFVVDGLEEPAFPAGMNAKSPFSWAKRPEIPPAIVVRLGNRK